MTLLRIRPARPDPDTPDQSALLMESALAAFHALHDTISLEIAAVGGRIAFFARVPEEAEPVVEGQIYAQYADAEIVKEPDALLDPQKNEVVLSQDLFLTSSDIFPVKRHPQFTAANNRQAADPLSAITSTLVPHTETLRGHVQVVLKPAHHLRGKCLRFLPLLTKGRYHKHHSLGKFFTQLHFAKGWRKWVLFPLEVLMGGHRTWFRKIDHALEEMASPKNHEREDPVAGAVDKVNRLLFLVNVRISVVCPKDQMGQAVRKLREIGSAFSQFSLPHSNGFSTGKARADKELPLGFRARPYLLSAEEVATIFHLPGNPASGIPDLDWLPFRQLPFPVDLPGADQEGVNVIGETIFRGRAKRFGLGIEDRKRHLYICGKTGVGKSVLLQQMIFSDIEAGHGVMVIDPHGDLAEACLRFIPKERTNDVLLIRPADQEWPIAFNPLDCKTQDQKLLITSGVISTMKRLWGEVWSGRMEFILRNTILALLDSENSTLLGVLRMYSDASFRSRIIAQVKNPVIADFWKKEFTSWTERYKSEALAAIQNKIGQLLASPLIRNIVAQPRSKIELRHVMDSGKVVIVDLAKGTIGEDHAKFIGGLLVTQLQVSAMSRANVSEKARRPFFVFLDEFQSFASESFSVLLAECRKFSISLTLAHQFVNQLLLVDGNSILRDAVFGNVNSSVIFQTGAEDAEFLSRQMEEVVSPKDILGLAKYHAYCRLSVNGMPSKPFSIRTLPPRSAIADEQRIAVIKRLSRERYCQPRSEVERQIHRWMGTPEKTSRPDRSGKPKSIPSPRKSSSPS